MQSESVDTGRDYPRASVFGEHHWISDVLTQGPLALDLCGIFFAISIEDCKEKCLYRALNVLVMQKLNNEGDTIIACVRQRCKVSSIL